MAKKDLQYYRWQFLRLNKDYQKLYDLFLKKYPQLTDRAFTAVPRPVAQRGGISWNAPLYHNQLEIDRQQKVMRKFGINGIFNPRFENPSKALKIQGPFDDAVRLGSLKENFFQEIQKDQFIDKCHLSEIYTGQALIDAAQRQEKAKKKTEDVLKEEIINFLHKKPQNHPKLSLKEFKCGRITVDKAIEVSINCDANLGAIHKQIDAIVKPIQKKRRQLSLQTRSKKRGKTHRKQELNKYLKTYDLREKHGLSNKAVAGRAGALRQSTLHPKSRPDESLSSDHYQVAKRLIQGGYKKILF